MCTLAKNLEAGQQKRFYSTLITQGIFLVLAKVLAHSKIKIRLSCADLINNVLTNDPNQVREFILSQKDSGYTFMHGLVDRVLHDSDTGIVTQYAEIIKCLLQTETMEDVTDRDKFLTLFYSEFLKRLVAALNDQEGAAETSPSKSGVLSFVPHQPSLQPHVTPLGKRKAGAAHLDQNEKGEGKGKEEEGKGEKEATETNEEKEKEGKANKKATKITENGPERDRVGKTPSATMMPFIDIQPHQSAVKHEICELLAFCVQNHGYHIKYFILGNNVASKVLKLLTHPEKHLVLAALRFFRAMVGAKDEFYNRHIIKFDLFQPIMELFKRNGSRYNLINSAIIELFDFIRKQNIKSLLHYLVNHFKQEFKAVTYVDTFKLLILKYKQNKDYQDNYHDKATSTTTASEKPEDSDNDDSYFFLGEDEEEEATKEKEKNATAKKAKKRAAALAAATKNTKETAEREGKEEDEEDEEDEDYKPGEEDEEGDGDQQKRKAIKPTTNGGTSEEEEEEEEEEDLHEILDRTEFLKRKREEEERQKAAEAKQRENERAKQKAAVAEMIAKEQQQEGSSMVLVGGEGEEKEEGESRGEDGTKEEGEEERASKRLRFTIQKAGGPTVTPTTSSSSTASSLSLKKNT
ncbi:phosphatase 4, regulatory subunit [Balamuthia mandrillaris]